MIKLNVEKFKQVLKKATLNLSFDSVQLSLSEETISSKMISRDNSAITMLSIPNDGIVRGVGTEPLVLNFVEPNVNLVPFLNLFGEDEIDLVKNESSMVLKHGKQRSTVRLSIEQAISIFTRPGVNPNIQNFVTLPVSDDFVELFGKIKKVGTRFGKVYFGVDDNTLYIETTDREEGFANSLRFELMENIDSRDLSLCYNFKNLVNLMNCLNGEHNSFNLSIATTNVGESVMGMVSVEKSDGTEKYYLTSVKENI